MRGSGGSNTDSAAPSSTWRTALDLNRVEVPSFQDPSLVAFSQDHLDRVEVIDNPEQLALQVALLTMTVRELSMEVAVLKARRLKDDYRDRGAWGRVRSAWRRFSGDSFGGGGGSVGR